MFIASVMLSNHFILWRPLLPLPSLFPSIRDFSNESSIHIRCPEYCSFSFNISSSSEYLGLISLKIDWFDLHPVQGTFRSLLYHHSSKASILWCSAFFTIMIQLKSLATLVKKAKEGSDPTAWSQSTNFTADHNKPRGKLRELLLLMHWFSWGAPKPHYVQRSLFWQAWSGLYFRLTHLFSVQGILP